MIKQSTTFPAIMKHNLSETPKDEVRINNKQEGSLKDSYILPPENDSGETFGCRSDRLAERLALQTLDQGSRIRIPIETQFLNNLIQVIFD